MHRNRPTQIFCSILLVLMAGRSVARAVEKNFAVFVALADNAAQGIVPVPAAIGNGEDPERNLYWGTAEGLQGVFDKSKAWRLVEKNADPEDDEVLRLRTYRHEKTGSVLTARAYRGTAMKKCIQDFEAAIQSQRHGMVVFIGHNGLMDFTLPDPVRPARQTNVTDCVVLCCKSEAYFKTRIENAGGRPVLLTTQLMYPGSFILHDVAEGWLNNESPAALRDRAGQAYAANQKISKKAATGVFARLESPPAPGPKPK